MTESSPSERRLHPRRECRIRVIFHDELRDGLLYLFSRDVSEGGICLESAIPARLGSMMFLSFQLPGQKHPIEATVEVVRSTVLGDGNGGMGVRFLGLSAEALKQLEAFLTLPPK